MNRRLYFTAIFIFTFASLVAQQRPGVVKATLNGLDFVFDAQSGSILSMSYPATGTMLKTSRDSAGIVDLAFPVTEFEPLRLASRFSKNARITKSKGMVTIHWDELGASRSFVKYNGKVSATVILKEEADGQSISMSCKIDNQSDRAVPQVVFPDFSGIVPFCGKEGTEFRTGGTAIKPFIDLVPAENDNFYAVNGSTRWFHYGFVLDGKNLVIKWMDIGGRKGGLSIFAKNWGTNSGYSEGVFLKLSETTGKLRYMNTLNIDIPQDSSWQSAEFILTPHQHGWAKGIIPYRNYAKQNVKPLYPLPHHVRDGLGYQTLWMRNFFYPEDPQGTNFKFSDLPAVARESKEHGLDEMVLWGWWNEPFKLPLPPPNKFLGTEQEFINAVAECKKIGVNVAPFQSVMIAAGKERVSKYGLGPDIHYTEYNYDPEFLPLLNPRYALASKGAVMVPHSNLLWQKEVLGSSKRQIDLGIPSACWDQYFSVGPGRHLDTIVTQIRKMAKEKDPQSTFSGEAGTNMENEYNYLDYTWNWDYDDGYDHRALISLLPAPRINVNIDKSVAEVKYGFSDNFYLNVYPRKPDGVNGSDFISNHPELSRALKQCARLRKQFLNYFVEGTFIADCILSKSSPDAHVSAYVLPKSILVIVINKNNQKEIRLESDIQPWLKSATGRYKIKHYNDGVLIKTTNISKPQWIQKTPAMKNLDICLYELIAE